MAGILYLIRLFVNHVERGRKSKEIHQLLTGMEHRLYKYITIPAMWVSWLAGLGIVYTMPIFASQTWFYLKFIFVVLLTAFTLVSGRLVQRFSAIDNEVPGGKKLRFLNEVPTILMMIIVALVIFKPFSG